MHRYHGPSSLNVVEKHLTRHCEERFSRRGNLELIDLCNCEIASLRSQRRLKYFFNNMLEGYVILLFYSA